MARAGAAGAASPSPIGDAIGRNSAAPRGVRCLSGYGGRPTSGHRMKEQERRRVELNHALLKILDEAMSVDRAACGKIRVYDPLAAALVIRAQRGFSEEFVESFAAVREDEVIACARAFRLKHRITVPDIALDGQSKAFRAAAKAEGFKAMQSTPLIGTRGRVIGTLSTHYDRVHHPSSAASLVLDHWAHKAAAVIEQLEPPDIGVP
jgi:hypothetical protein